ncbi:MAG: SIS domain-containing protein [Vicinamibacterales bacterium]|jgi:D-sedoheptulose 7-phosphate isomerase|nr:SIS domain-containing protein [Vicinamibacterales bacterium]HJN46895.1 SIS domain-containing protein [Vicinamibacterales bacterium]
MNHVDRLVREARDAAAYGRAYADHLGTLLARLDVEAIGRLADLLVDVRAAGRMVYLAGNGGSAACASHWATDLLNGTFVPGTPPLRAMSLVDNVALLTAIANDQSYARVLTGQLEKLLAPRDVLIIISASGNSPNVVDAAKYAKTRGASTVGVLGFDGGHLKELCDLVIMVPTPPGEYGPVEDVHLVISHILTTWLKARFEAEGR